MAKQPKAKVVTANALVEGDVVYLSPRGWSRRFEDAEVLTDEHEAQQRLALAVAQSGQVVGAYLAEVKPGDDGNGHVPAHFREDFRARGPTNYFHGKQAEH